LLNNDTRVTGDWLAELVETIEERPEVTAVGSKLMYLERPTVVNHAGGRLTSLGAAYDIGLGADDDQRFNIPGPVGCATGAALLVRRDLFFEVGGFDERYFAYFDDADLCWRFWLRGYQVLYQPRARVLHAYGGSASGGRLSMLRLQHCQTNRLQNMFKRLETRMLTMLPMSLGYDALRTLQLARAGRLDGVRALARGTRRFAEFLPEVMAERRRVQARRRRSDRELLGLGVMASLGEARREWRRLGGLSSEPGA
jgi:GT2 family glycosyltransferase